MKSEMTWDGRLTKSLRYIYSWKQPKDDNDCIESCVNACVIEHTTFLVFPFLEFYKILMCKLKSLSLFLQNQTMYLAQEARRNTIICGNDNQNY